MWKVENVLGTDVVGNVQDGKLARQTRENENSIKKFEYYKGTERKLKLFGSAEWCPEGCNLE